MISKKNGIELLFYQDINLNKLNLEEDSEILKENAQLKAISCAKQTGYMSLGDDSGVFIEALDYFPGVHSRRWSGVESDDTGRNEQIIALMSGEENRTAYLISRFALADKDGNIIGNYVVKNSFNIANAIDGTHGFGYDPILQPKFDNVVAAYQNGRISKEDTIFILNNNNTLTIGDLPQNIKNAINNRGKIAKEVKADLEKLNGKD